MNSLSLFRDIQNFILDVDGVLTDGNILLDASGDLLRTMNTRDGYAMHLAMKKGYAIYVITGGRSAMVEKRLRGLGVKDVFLGIENKLDCLLSLNLDLQKTLYMGDDMPDYDAMQKCILPVCPDDAVWQVKNIARYISPQKGGQGCVRDVVEKVLTLNDHWG